MATSRPSTPSNLVQVHTYRHLAPAYAAAPSQGSGVPQPAASSTLNNHSNTVAVRPFTPLEVRQLVLEYLAHEGYVDSAIAFASEMVTEDPDADASAASGEEEESHASPARIGSNALAAAGGSNHSTVTDGEAMQEDVEATADDETTSRRSGAAAAAAAEMRIGAADSPVINGNGKNVAFLDEGEGVAGANGTVKPSALSEEEVQDLRLRKTIRDAIVTGRIGQAVDLLNAHYPNVLAPPPPPLPASTAVAASTASVSSKSAFARPLAASKSSTPSSCTPQTFFVAPSPTPAPPPHRASPVPHLRPSSFSPSHSTSAVTGAQFGSWASSLAPEIISLNLQTQTFIELMRTAHATSAISTPSTPTSSVHGGLTGGAGGGGDAHSSDAEMSASTSSLGGSASILNVAIAQSQALREKVLQLPVGKDREGWERECIDVCGLLAYKDLATCPVRGYLSQSRRDILAEMVNSAILQHTGRTPLSLLSLAARQATAIWDTLREMWHPFPPPEAITTGRDRDSNNGKNKPPRTFPIFDLHTFLRDRDGAPPTPPHPPVDDMEA
ncbi:hypothetical protein JCM8115_005410 [Rhodotorula mucilaginosa]